MLITDKGRVRYISVHKVFHTSEVACSKERTKLLTARVYFKVLLDED